MLCYLRKTRMNLLLIHGQSTQLYAVQRILTYPNQLQVNSDSSNLITARNYRQANEVTCVMHCWRCQWTK